MILVHLPSFLLDAKNLLGGILSAQDWKTKVSIQKVGSQCLCFSHQEKQQ
jgi:hypothetical protein